jgi:hypothetical protein
LYLARFGGGLGETDRTGRWAMGEGLLPIPHSPFPILRSAAQAHLQANGAGMVKYSG